MTSSPPPSPGSRPLPSSATPTGAEDRSRETSWAARAGDHGLRLLALLAGAGLLVGFFLPWLRFGEFAALSGLSLMTSSGTAVESLTGPSRGLLIMIPFCGAALLASGLFAPRLAPFVALASGAAILAFGLFTLARVFLQTIGTGMWTVVAASLLAAGVGIAELARRRSRSPDQPDELMR